MPPVWTKTRLLYNGLDFDPRLGESLKIYADRARTGINRGFSSLRAAYPGKFWENFLRKRHPRLIFWLEFCKRPRLVGAICPSGKFLARTMAGSIPPGDGVIVETGAGTGAVTSAILASGIQPGQLLVIEYSPVMCRILRARFPEITIIQGDAAHLRAYLPAGTKVLAVVSSLPLMSFPESLREAVLEETARVLGPHGCVIQFTYALTKTSPYARKGFERNLLRVVPINLPPAKVERFTVAPRR